MKCKTCGAELNGGEKVCPNCGNPVELENEREAEENTEKVMENTAQPEKKGGKRVSSLVLQRRRWLLQERLRL